jgi:hypothetical protein
VNPFGFLWAGLTATGIAFPASSTVSLTQPAVAGTGANAGNPFSITAQPGQQQSGSNANNAGGALNLSSGAAGTGGSGAAGVAGPINLQIGGVTQFSVNGAKTVVSVTPATIQWPAATVAPTISQAAAVSGAGANITIAPQAATTTGASGSVVVNAAAPAGATTTEAGIQLNRAGTKIGIWSCLPGFSTFGGIFAGGITPTNVNALIQYTIDSQSIWVTGQSSVTLRVGGNSILSLGVNTASSIAGVPWGIPGGLGGISAAPFNFTNSAVTLATSGTTSLSSAQQGTPNITVAAVTLVGAATLAFGNVTGTFWLDLSAVTYAGSAITLTNGTGTAALPVGTQFVTVKCTNPNLIVVSGAVVPLVGDVTGTSAASVVSAISGVSPIAITPSTLQWAAATVAPTISQATALSDVATANLRIQSQAPFASATVNTNPGSIQLNVPTSVGTTVLPGVSVMSGGAEYFRFAGPYGTPQLQTLGVPCLGVVSGFSSLYAPSWVIHSGGAMYFDASSITFRTVSNVQYAFLSSTSFSTCPLQGAASGTPFSFVNSAVTLTSNAATLSVAQQQTPNLTLAAVTLTGAGLLDFGNVTGNFQVNILGVNAASFATFGLSFKNGTTTTALPSTALTNGGLVLVRCDPNTIVFCA